jgi:hypothetical protein
MKQPSTTSQLSIRSSALANLSFLGMIASFSKVILRGPMRIARLYEHAVFYTDFLYHSQMIWAVQRDVKGFDRLNTKERNGLSFFWN